MSEVLQLDLFDEEAPKTHHHPPPNTTFTTQTSATTPQQSNPKPNLPYPYPNTRPPITTWLYDIILHNHGLPSSTPPPAAYTSDEGWSQDFD